MKGRAALTQASALLLAEILVLGSGIGQAAAASQPATAMNPSGDEHQILVMLRLPPDHHRPGPSYDGAYGDQVAAAARQRLAQRIAHRHGLEFVGDGWPMAALGVDCYVMRVPPGETPESAVKRISDDPNILWSQPMHVYQTPEDGMARH